MKKVLLLGGTGAIGKSLVNYLNTEEMEVYVTTRKNIQDKENIKYIPGNAHEIDFLKKILFEHEFDVIVDFMLYSYEELKRKIELFLENTKQYIFISSARVYSNLDENICENTKRLLDVCEDKEYLMEEEYAPVVVDLDGEQFEIIETLEFEDKMYAALTPYTEEDEMEEDDVEFIILEVIDDEESEQCTLKTVDDEELYTKIGDKFMEVFADAFGEE